MHHSVEHRADNPEVELVPPQSGRLPAGTLPGGSRRRSAFARPDTETGLEKHARVVSQLGERFPAAAELLAFTHFPKEHWRQL